MHVVHSPRLQRESEQDLADRVLAELSEWFHIDREVAGSHYRGRRLRLDAVLRPHDPSLWKDDDPFFGVEFKLCGTQKFQDTKDFTSWSAQAVDYTHVDWDGYGYMKVFMCPSASRYFSDRTAAVMSRLLWQLGVGELAHLVGEGWTLLAQGDHALWSQRRGVFEAKRWSLLPKAGSR
jgi:hypothetical protein